MPNPEPDDLFKIDKEMFERFRKDPEALAEYFEKLVQEVARPVRAAVHATRVEQKFPVTIPAPDIEMDSLFPLTDLPKTSKVPVAKTPSPTVHVTPPDPVTKSRPTVSPPSKPAPLVEIKLDSRPATVHQVDYAVPQVQPKVAPASPVIADLHKMVPKKEPVAPSQPVPTPMTDAPLPTPSEGVQSKDIADAEKRRKERESIVSSVMKKDQGNVL